MTVLCYQTLRRLQIVEPFEERTRAFGLTYGLGPCGIDIRIADSILLPPGGFALVSSFERFNMPADVMAVVHDKSTWARTGLLVQNTVIEPGWKGYLMLELTNHLRPSWWRSLFNRRSNYNYIRLQHGMPIAQIVFHRLDEPTHLPYAGKYQDQRRGTPAILEGPE